MSPFEIAFKKLISDAIVEAYDRIKDGETVIAESDGKKEEAVESAPAKRTRRTKAEIEATTASAKAEVGAVVETAPAKSKSAVSYDTLKEIVFEYVLENGKPAAEKILQQFGVTSAQKLQPEQWDEAYSLFVSAKAEAEESIA
jgi:hypothetical protein